ncbi:uncharacterized protein LOC119167989 [Rhipicephalus microplus]|uniref:uncharacterized protein LOC119167989 n=1 Tax=Rhipicephalus microplus TaxID=6941 RepID=UPI0018873E96|nr:uncharacterized protein LOC119167989 [Rhipicephalus microplus]
MKKLNISATLAIAVITIIIKCNGKRFFPANVFSVPNIRKFYTDNTTIWTMLTTQSNVTCKVDLVANKSKTSVFFERHYCLGKQWINETLEGTFIKASPFAKKGALDAMLVHPPGVVGLMVEQLLVTNRNRTCGVFKIYRQQLWASRDADAIYELRVRNPNSTEIEKKCMNKFTKYSSHKGRKIYSSHCNAKSYDCSILPE